MIRIEKESLPKEYERAIIEEYYNMYKEREGFPIPITQNVRYTADITRLRKRDLNNTDLMKAIKAYSSIKEDNIEFICYGPDDIITAIARIMLSEDNIHIIDILFLDYPYLQEKMSYIKNIIDVASNYGYQNGCKTISCEVGKTDKDSLLYTMLNNMGFVLSKDAEKEASNYPTYILEKEIIRKHEQTRSRKQE